MSLIRINSKIYIRVKPKWYIVQYWCHETKSKGITTVLV